MSARGAGDQPGGRRARGHLHLDARGEREHLGGHILLPAISEDTGMSVTTLQWAVTGYSLVGAAVIVTSGSLGDVFGRKRIFQLGLLLFVASCVLIALAESGGVVIAGRVIQGRRGDHPRVRAEPAVGREQGQAQLRAVSCGARRRQSVRRPARWWAACSSMSPGGRGCSGSTPVVAVGCMVLTAATVSESRDPDRPRSIDYAGTVLIALTLTPLILAVSKSSDWGWFWWPPSAA